MATATVTSKGQITIPKAIRDSLHLRSGDRVEFLVHGEMEAVLRPCNRTVDDVSGSLHESGRTKRSVEDMHEAAAGRMRIQGG